MRAAQRRALKERERVEQFGALYLFRLAPVDDVQSLEVVGIIITFTRPVRAAGRRWRAARARQRRRGR